MSDPTDRRSHLNDAYNQVVRVLDQFHSSLDNISGLDYAGYKRSAIHSRLTQKIAEIILQPFLHASSSGRVNSNSLNLGGLQVDFASGRIRLTLALWFRSQLEFWAHWLHVLYHALASVIKMCPRDRRSAVVLFGVGEEAFNGPQGDTDFVRFCRYGPLRFLHGDRRLVVEAPTASLRPGDSGLIQYSRFPVLYLLRAYQLSLREFATLLKWHLKSVLAYVEISFKYPRLAVLGRDFSYHGLACWLNDRGMVRDVVVTNSNMSRQFLWMTDLPQRQFHLHTVWYSTNNRPLAYKGAIEAEMTPQLQWLRSDHMWVWNQGQEDYLAGVGQVASMHIAGPILWYLDEQMGRRESGKIRIGIFEVTPVSEEVVQRSGFAASYYYTYENVRKFVEDIRWAATELESKGGRQVEIVLKHKRLFAPSHDRRYIDFVHRLSAEDQRIVVVSTRANLFHLTRECDASVVLPFSSPAYVSAHVGTSAIYYDPTGTLAPKYDRHDKVSFASTREGLLEFLVSAVGSSKRRNDTGNSAEKMGAD